MAKKTLEENFERLDEIIETMESGELDLGEMFEKYKEGLKLVKSSNEMIDTVEKEMKILEEAENEDDSEETE